MFKPQKPQPTNQAPIRHKMPIVERAPKQEDISSLFTNAQRMRGTLIELPIKPNSQSQTFSITCQFDHSANETVWSMTAADGNLLWSIPQSDLDLVFDMVVMACQPQGSGGATQLPPELAPPSSTAFQSAPQSAPQQAAQSAPAQNQVPPQYPPTQGAPYQPQYQQGAQQPYQTPPTQGYPGQPYGQPAYGQPQYPPPAPAPYPQNGYGAPAQAPPPAQAPIWNPPAGQPAAPATPNYPSTPELSNFIDLLNKGQPNMLLGHLFVEAGIVPERCLDAALKLQEMVRDGKLNNAQAILALKKASEFGGQLDEAVIEWAKDPEKHKKPQAKPATPSAKPAASGATGAGSAQTSKPGMDAATMARVIDLLKQSGLVSEQDIETASKVKSKHGGDLGQILVSAGKIAGKTLEAAAECQEYMRFGRLRIDKAIMALHYCERMRASLRDALDELSITLD